LPPASSRREWLGRLGLVLLSVVLVLVLFELGLRAVSGWLFDWHNLVLAARTVHSANEQSRFMHDALVGYVPRPDGLRPTGEAPTMGCGEALLRLPGQRPGAAQRAGAAASRSAHDLDLLAAHPRTLVPVRLRDAPARPALRLVRRSRTRPSPGRRRAHRLPS